MLRGFLFTDGLDGDSEYQRPPVADAPNIWRAGGRAVETGAGAGAVLRRRMRGERGAAAVSIAGGATLALDGCCRGEGGDAARELRFCGEHAG